MSLGTGGSETLLGSGAVGPSPQPSCLIVEDQALIGLSLEAYLEEVGFGLCETFPSAKEALAWIGTSTPTVAILDYSLQGWPLHRARSHPAGAWHPLHHLLRPWAGHRTSRASGRAMAQQAL